MFTVADEPNYSRPLLVNPDFSRLTANRTIPKTRAGTVSFVDMECLEKCFRSLLEGNSHALWLMSGLLSQLKADGFSPSDPSLFEKAMSPISFTLASQTSLAAAMAEFMVTNRFSRFLFPPHRNENFWSPLVRIHLFSTSLSSGMCLAR